MDTLSSMDSRISWLIDSLPTLTKDDVDIHDNCPICFVDFKTILDDEDSQTEGAGVTRLLGCHHVFCRKDLVQWIRSWHGSCPTCRNIFLSNLQPRSESDDESDDEEYEPNENDDYEDEYEDEEDEDISFDDGPDELLEDPEGEEGEFGEGEEFEEEHDYAMGFDEIEDFYGYHQDSFIEAEDEAPVGAAEEELQDVEVYVAEEEAGYSGEEAQAEEEACIQSEEPEYSEDEACIPFEEPEDEACIQSEDPEDEECIHFEEPEYSEDEACIQPEEPEYSENEACIPFEDSEAEECLGLADWDHEDEVLEENISEEVGAEDICEEFDYEW